MPDNNDYLSQLLERVNQKLNDSEDDGKPASPSVSAPNEPLKPRVFTSGGRFDNVPSSDPQPEEEKKPSATPVAAVSPASVPAAPVHKAVSAKPQSVETELVSKPEKSAAVAQEKPEQKSDITPKPPAGNADEQKPVTEPYREQEAKPEPRTEIHSSPPAPEPKPQPPRQSAPNLDEIYRNAKPFPQWIEVVNKIRPISKSTAAAFTGSLAYESGDYLLIDVNNETAFDLLKSSSKRDEVRRAIRETTGRVFRLGPYKKPSAAQKNEDKLDTFKSLIKDSGIEITEE